MLNVFAWQDLLLLNTVYIPLILFIGAQANAGEGVVLEEYQGDKIKIYDIKAVSECIQHASNPDIVCDMEEIASVWCKQIEQVSCSWVIFGMVMFPLAGLPFHIWNKNGLLASQLSGSLKAQDELLWLI